MVGRAVELAPGAGAGVGALLWAHTLNGTSNAAATPNHTRGMNFPRRRVHAEQHSPSLPTYRRSSKTRRLIVDGPAKFSLGVTFAPRLVA